MTERKVTPPRPMTGIAPSPAATIAGPRFPIPQLDGWRRWAAAGLLGLGCLLLASVRTQEAVPLVAPLATLPATIDGYTSVDRVVGDEERRVAGMSNYVMRVFQRDTVPAFSLYVGYYEYQTQGKSIHSPKNCLPGAGWEVMNASRATVATAIGAQEVNRYLLAKGKNRALVYYWYQGRGRVAASEYRVKWDLLRDAALTGRSEEALVRIVIPVVGAATPAALAAATKEADTLAARVAGQVIPEVSRVLPAAPLA